MQIIVPDINPGQNTRYPLPVPELPEPGPELPNPRYPNYTQITGQIMYKLLLKS